MISLLFIALLSVTKPDTIIQHPKCTLFRVNVLTQIEDGMYEIRLSEAWPALLYDKHSINNGPGHYVVLAKRVKLTTLRTSDGFDHEYQVLEECK